MTLLHKAILNIIIIFIFIGCNSTTTNEEINIQNIEEKNKWDNAIFDTTKLDQEDIYNWDNTNYK